MTIREFKTAVNLEARMAALFVQNASRFGCKVLLRRGDMVVNCKSIMGVVSLSIREGQDVSISATGPGEAEAVEVLSKMLAEG